MGVCLPQVRYLKDDMKFNGNDDVKKGVKNLQALKCSVRGFIRMEDYKERNVRTETCNGTLDSNNFCNIKIGRHIQYIPIGNKRIYAMTDKCVSYSDLY